MIEVAKHYWDFRLKYGQLAPAARRMVLQGEALLALKDTESAVVRRRFAAFISRECIDYGLADKTASFV